MDAPFDALAAACRQALPRVAIVLGSGSNVVADRVRPLAATPFAAIPGLEAPTVAGHRGRLTLGRWAGQAVLVFEGRLHYYEGHSWDKVTEPVRLAQRLGASVFLATNAAGGIASSLGPGSLMVVRDHIRWNLPYAWRVPGPGARPSPYDPELVAALRQAGAGLGLDLMAGVYASLTGPCYETPAEIRALRAWGADAVGMSTAVEVEAAVALGMRCAAVSCITNKAAGLGEGPLDHTEVLANAAAQTGRLADLVERWLGNPLW